MRGVITMNEEYETRFLCNTSKVRTGALQPGQCKREKLVGGGALRVTVLQTKLPSQVENTRIKFKWL